jgi:hypothetical protein
MEPAIVPYCLYRKGQFDSYISLPVKSRENDKTVLKCPPLPDMQPITIFYAINPDIRPIPPGMALLCLKNIPEENVTIDVSPIYDIFNIDQKCYRMMVWLDPVPYTTSIYLSKKNNSMHISLSKDIPAGYEPLYFSPMYVLIDPRQEAIRTKGHKGQNYKDFKIVDNQPNFLFSGYQGKCIPDPNGISLGECIVKYVKDIFDPNNKEPTLINYLNSKYGNKLDTKTILLFCILILCSFLFLYFVFYRNKN